ncbi:hypothetical protein JV46_03280 [Solemya velum gill symbiont]|uniref:Hemerythrin n=1 Tax=Solemya velum gill symbiont TaxID=2340 RepID=A0A0B0H836_SOVGS|nr:hypothetical protein JV46_03280 [Solemya velum gill symbiont]
MTGEKYKLPQLVLEFLIDWWTNHILVEDMKYKDFFRDKGVS